MKIAIVGATGSVGSRLVTEALNRGHEVTGISRHPEKLPSNPKLHGKAGDVAKPDELAALLKGHDVVISTVRFQHTDPHAVISAVKKSGVKRLLVVGGAASLETAPGVPLFDSPHFPDAYKPEAGAGLAFLKVLRGEQDLDWTFLSPAGMFPPGERTGKFRVGGDQLMTDAAGKSSISQEDYAIAMIDEVEHPKHVKRRFSVAY